MVTGQRPRASEFPEPERCARHSELSGEGSLRQPAIESATANVLPKRLGLVRVTPWNRGLSARTQPEAGKRQRNGASAAGSDIPSVGAGVRILILRVIQPV